MHRHRLSLSLLVPLLAWTCSSSDTGNTGPGGVSSVVLAPDSAWLEIGDTLQVRAEAQSGASVLSGSSLTWSSSNPAAVTVTSDGHAIATGAGSATVTASAGTQSASGTIIVQPPVTSLALTPVDTIRRRVQFAIGVAAFSGALRRPTRISVRTNPAGIFGTTWDPGTQKILVAPVEGTGWVVATAPSGATDSVKIVVEPDVYECCSTTVRNPHGRITCTRSACVPRPPTAAARYILR